VDKPGVLEYFLPALAQRRKENLLRVAMNETEPIKMYRAQGGFAELSFVESYLAEIASAFREED